MKNPTTPKPDETDWEKVISHAEHVADPFGKFLDGLCKRETLEEQIKRKTRNWVDHQYRAEIKRLMEIINEMADEVDSAVKAYDAVKAK